MSGRVEPHRLLAVLADLAPSGREARATSIARADLVPLPISYVSTLRRRSALSWDPASGERIGLNPKVVGPLLKRAKLHDEEGLLRIGWLWVLGRNEHGDVELFPLVSMPVRTPRLQAVADITRRVLLSAPSYTDVLPAGEAEITDRVTDPVERVTLESTIEVGGGALEGERSTVVDPRLLRRLSRLQVWARRGARAAGWPDAKLGGELPRQLATSATAAGVVIPQVALYLATPERVSPTIASTLRSWPRDDIDGTAFGAMYGAPAAMAPHPAADAPVNSSIVLSPVQREVVAAARRDPITVVSGPPGTGKTQTVAAIALDAIEHGRSVLVAAPSPAAVDALIDLMTRTPGPDPVVFGSTDRRLEVADRLGQGGGQRFDRDQVETARAAAERAQADAASARAAVRDRLAIEAGIGPADPLVVERARRLAPAWFDAAVPLYEADRLLAEIDRSAGWFGGLRRRRAGHALAAHAGATTVDPDELRAALRSAHAVRDAARTATADGDGLAALWDRLVAADEARRSATARWLNAFAHRDDGLDRGTRATMSVVAAALRSGRAARRERLGEIDGGELTSALPLWIGTLRDIDDLLPRTCAMFDLVIVDEASQVDQISAAPALLRATQAVVVGDPKQLRHVSFVADATVRETVAAHDIDDPTLAAQLDVRRLSLFDLAAGAAPTRFLDEHFRSAPHLIEFSARHFYDGALTVATRHPRNHARDCISVVTVDGTRDDAGVNTIEIDEIVALIRRELETDTDRTVGVVSAFRKQVDAIEARLVDEFTIAEIDRLALRVGTVHGFQGCERDLLLISMCVDDESVGASLAHVADPNLFNVMITRARDEIVVVSSLTEHPTGTVGQYLRHGELPPALPADRPPAGAARAVHAELRRQSVSVHGGYPAGRHSIDLVLGDGDDALGVFFGSHPDGADAHVDRHLALRRAGWELREFVDATWSSQPSDVDGVVAVELLLEAQRRSAAGER